MELMKGYKETTVGVIPSDWQVVPITSLIEKNSRITYGVVQPGKDDPRGVEFIRGGDVYDGKIDEENLRKIPHSVDAQYSRTKLCGGELLISLVGFPGECAIVPVTLKGANIARQVALARLDKGLDFEPDFICHFLRSSIGKKLLLREAFGSAQQVINLKDVNKLELPLPSLLEQRDIATALSDVDALIAGLEKLIAKKRVLKQAAMQQLLTGQTRLPGFSGEWEVKRLGDVAALKNGYMFRSETYLPVGDYKVITIANVQGGYMTTEGCNVVVAPPKDVQPHQELKIGDILVSMTGNVGRVCRVSEENCLLNQRVGKLVPVCVSSDFLFSVLCCPSFTENMIGTAKGGAQPNLSAADINEYEFRMPLDFDEQMAISTVIANMDDELSAMELRKAKTCELKQGMMQELLTGRTRLV